MKFASIDIGSNAVRLLFCNVYEKPNGETVFKKASLIRVPLRLGEDAFMLKRISDDKCDKMVKTMRAFKELIEVHEVLAFRACATSAMRESENGRELIERIKKEAGLEIEIVDGATEAEIIYSNHIEEMLNPKKAYLYIDVGGGSTELTVFDNNKIVASKSFNIGTIRILQNKVDKETWNQMQEWIKINTENHSPLMAIGSGGNINKLYNMTKKKEDRTISFRKLNELYGMLNSYNYEERIKLLDLNPDRADVIVPATEIFITVMKTADIERVLVPQIGMSDGIIHLLYENYKKQNKSQEKTKFWF
ncbi:MAG: exopolyphosphatase [Bacteroidota bacterium]